MTTGQQCIKLVVKNSENQIGTKLWLQNVSSGGPALRVGATCSLIILSQRGYSSKLCHIV